MSTDPATIEFLIDQLGRRGASYTTKRMFGEYCLYRDGLPVAFVCDDVLFVKDTRAGRAAIEQEALPEFGPPYPGAKPYLRLAPDAWDNGDWLRRVLDATAAALPPAKPRKARSSDALPADRARDGAKGVEPRASTSVKPTAKPRARKPRNGKQ